MHDAIQTFGYPTKMNELVNLFSCYLLKIMLHFNLTGLILVGYRKSRIDVFMYVND